MKISWNWLSELVDLSKVGTPEKLADLLTFRGLEVEEIENQAKGFEKVITAKILVRDKHPQADRLSLCKVDTGSGELEIVCGAQNMKAGDTVALAQIGALLPNGLKIELSKIRGVVSNGMLCSEDELGLSKPGQKSEGILILPAGTKLGEPLAKILGLDDVLFSLKLTANRGDCLSHFGIAREVASALGIAPKAPKFSQFKFDGSCPVKITLDAGADAPQFLGISVDGVRVGPSPAWVVKRLEAVGSRSINNVVDATNLVMLEFGHPLHAYDATKISGNKIGVRKAQPFEVLPLLDGTQVTLTGSELVIADGERAVGLAGVMGGGNSEVQDGTTRLFLECAEFSPTLVRQASTKHQKKTDAAHRFERGIDPQGLERAISRLATLVMELAGGKVTGASRAEIKQTEQRRPIQVSQKFFSDFLGLDVEAKAAEQILKNLDCTVKSQGSDFLVTPPSYRRDLTIAEDLAEEIARTVGYDKIPSTIPKLTGVPTFAASSRGAVSQMDRAKDAMASLGFFECVNLAFTSQSWLSKFGFQPTVCVMNPLSADHEAMVPSLIPGLIKNGMDNWNHNFGSEVLPLRLFELRPVFSSRGQVAATAQGETGVIESWKLAFVASGLRAAQELKVAQSEIDFYDIKAVVEGLLAALGTRGARIVAPGSPGASPSAPQNFHPGQTAELRVGKESAGFFGLIHPALTQELKLKAPLWACELDWKVLSQLSTAANESRSFKSWGEFPPMERDFALLVRSDVTAEKITQVALKSAQPLAKVARIFDIYRGSQVAQGMTSVAVRVIFYEESRSLTEAEAEAASQKILAAWKKELGIELR